MSTDDLIAARRLPEPAPPETEEEERKRKRREWERAYRAANPEKVRARERAKEAKRSRVRTIALLLPGSPIPGMPASKIRVSRDGTVWKPHLQLGCWVPRAVHTEKSTPKITFRINGVKRRYAIASLVCLAFHGPRPSDHEPLHYPDPNPLNCHAENLRWAPRGTRFLGQAKLPQPRNDYGHWTEEPHHVHDH